MIPYGNMDVQKVKSLLLNEFENVSYMEDICTILNLLKM